ncbi:capsule assembly Wzi family protein [Robertkochia aurantiaca]|uniref:capsule assembly Wzi family protein n=1 Tax=Robertkochia aurantiaca TaxID=2873700 RepID=UPI001CCBF7F1|nr:capsule assembly Wzi family protein [Robertkochia sp. 3YJGBD-33]
MCYRLKRLLFALSFPLISHAQQTLYSGQLEGMAYFGTDAELPFWMASNNFGRVEEESTVYGMAGFAARREFSRWGFLEAGIGITATDAGDPAFRADHWYLTYENYWFGIDAGKKQPEPEYGGLAAADPSWLRSNNARPMPGARIYTARPLFLDRKESFAFEAEWGEYVMDDDRAVDKARVHHKQLRFHYQATAQSKFVIGFEHFTQYDGRWPVTTEWLDGLADYATIVAGARERDQSKNTPEIGGDWNQLAMYSLRYQWFWPKTRVEFFWDHMFEDGSGMRLSNFPDGRYGVFIKRTDDEVLWDSFIYEFYYTKNQSDGNDNYFNHGVFSSGWTYHKRMIGSPFFLPAEDGSGIAVNELLVHHFGLGGDLWKLRYKALLSYRKNYGTPTVAYSGEREVLSGGLDITWQNKVLPVRLFIGADWGDENKNAAVGIGFTKLF